MDNRKKLVVLGGGESGVGAAILGKDKGMDVFLSDMGHITPRYADRLDAEGISWEQGTHTLDRILQADEVVKSPGIPPTSPVMKAISEKGIPVISEIELAGRYTDAKMVCITGSNGKTTTTMLTYHILRDAGIDAGLAGNVGKSLALQVARDPHDVYVIELSSFQLENMYDFKANVAVILNITPDHLDRYEHSMELYADAKMRITRNQTPSDCFIYWQEDPETAAAMTRTRSEATPLPFGVRRTPSSAAWLEGDVMHISTPQGAWSMPREEIAIKGLHNIYNSMAASIAATRLGIAPEVIRKALASFKAVPHRLEHVAEIDGVEYINDSKATNEASTYYALESMTRPTVLILGGTDKGNDYTDILDFMRRKVTHVVAMGADNEKIMRFCRDHGFSADDTHSLADALQACRKAARPGDTVLLSPCCASFDLFKSYIDRGDRFRAAVLDLMESHHNQA